MRYADADADAADMRPTRNQKRFERGADSAPPHGGDTPSQYGRRPHGLTRSKIFDIIHVLSLQRYAGIAQLVERNLAKVEVASSRLVSRSRF